MRLRVITTIIAALLASWAMVAPGQQPAQQIPRTADGTPRLDGIWQALTEANWDIRPHTPVTRSFPSSVRLQPFIPDSASSRAASCPIRTGRLRKQQENFANRLERDPEANCFMPGVPRATYMPHPSRFCRRQISS